MLKRETKHKVSEWEGKNEAEGDGEREGGDCLRMLSICWESAWKGKETSKFYDSAPTFQHVVELMLLVILLLFS